MRMQERESPSQPGGWTKGQESKCLCLGRDLSISDRPGLAVARPTLANDLFPIATAIGRYLSYIIQALLGMHPIFGLPFAFPQLFITSLPDRDIIILLGRGSTSQVPHIPSQWEEITKGPETQGTGAMGATMGDCTPHLHPNNHVKKSFYDQNLNLLPGE